MNVTSIKRTRQQECAIQLRALAALAENGRLSMVTVRFVDENLEIGAIDYDRRDSLRRDPGSVSRHLSAVRLP